MIREKNRRLIARRWIVVLVVCWLFVFVGKGAVKRGVELLCLINSDDLTLGPANRSLADFQSICLLCICSLEQLCILLFDATCVFPCLSSIYKATHQDWQFRDQDNQATIYFNKSFLESAFILARTSS